MRSILRLSCGYFPAIVGCPEWQHSFYLNYVLRYEYHFAIVMCNGPKYSAPQWYYPETGECMGLCFGRGRTEVNKRDLIALKMKMDDTAGQKLRWQGGVI